MFNSIPASAIATVVPGVVGTGGNSLNLSGLMLTDSKQSPIGLLQNFPDAPSVGAYFGLSSAEYRLAQRYFLGFANRQSVPGEMLVMQYPTAAVKAYMRGGSLASMTLAQLQALSGDINITVNGVAVSATGLSLAAATSFSNAASIIQTAFGASDATFTGAIAGNTLTVSAVAAGTIAVGQTVTGSTTLAGTTITALGSGTGGTGTYTVSGAAQSVGSTTLKSGPLLVTFDAVANAFKFEGGTPGSVLNAVPQSVTAATVTPLATSLMLTTAAGAVTSAGADKASPGAFMTAAAGWTNDWCSFWTTFKPSIPDMIAFAQWNSAQGSQFAYLMWDNDITLTAPNASASAPYAVQQQLLQGIFPIYDPTEGADKAAFVAGSIASIDFTRSEGRTNFAFRQQAGLAIGVTSLTVAKALKSNGCSYYGRWGTANDEFTFLYDGAISGPFAWLDSFIDQVWLSSQLQLAILTLFTTNRHIPYNPAGYAKVSAALLVPIKQAITFGAIVSGVELSSAQINYVNNDAGVRIDDALFSKGFYLQILPASAQVRGQRGSPPCTLWYCDGGNIQSINLASVEVQ